ncbi:MAG: hypothetical protein ACI81I_000082 [Arcobacteraceae bacterium]|jgi:hypothetical protein
MGIFKAIQKYKDSIICILYFIAAVYYIIQFNFVIGAIYIIFAFMHSVNLFTPPPKIRVIN